MAVINLVETISHIEMSKVAIAFIMCEGKCERKKERARIFVELLYKRDKLYWLRSQWKLSRQWIRLQHKRNGKPQHSLFHHEMP